MAKNIRAAQKHNKNLSQAHGMLLKIIEYVNVQKASADLLNGVCSWCDVAESERIVNDLKDLHD